MVRIKRPQREPERSSSKILCAAVLGAILMLTVTVTFREFDSTEGPSSETLTLMSLANSVETNGIKVESVVKEKDETIKAIKSPKPKLPLRREAQIHVVFSTSCSYEQDWQSYLFFFHAMIHEQPGNVTRIVSGCTPAQEIELSKIHQERIAVMNDRFHLHFTPNFGKVKGFSWQTTKYWNKPFGVKHWLQEKFGYRYEGDEPVSTPFDDDIVVLVDPDMFMQRPFINNFSNVPNSFWHNSIQSEPGLYHKVSHGHPIAQTYSFGDAWVRAANKGNMTDIVGPDSPALSVSRHDAEVTFSAGPPYMLTALDMYQLSYHWALFTPRIQKHFEGMMAEMYGYCTAAAHLNLRHQIAKGFMLSNINMDNGEGWEFLSNAGGDVCNVEQFKDTVPHVIHFCQRYSIGEHFLSKYKIPNDIMVSCDHSMFELPPLDIANYTKYSHYGDDSIKTWAPKNKKQIIRNTFMVCSIMNAMNRAGKFFRDHNCPDGANYNQTWNHFREAELQHCQKNPPKGCPI